MAKFQSIRQCFAGVHDFVEPDGAVVDVQLEFLEEGVSAQALDQLKQVALPDGAALEVEAQVAQVGHSLEGV